MSRFRYLLSMLSLALLLAVPMRAQELLATVEINTQQVEGTKTSVFESLKTAATQFLNDRRWTSFQYAPQERIRCTFNIIVSKFNEESGQFTAEAYISVLRPVFNASYVTTTLSRRDRDFSFEYHDFDQLEFRVDQVDNALTALLAYYAYLIIGIDMDSMALLGGSEALQTALDIANNAQNLNVKGWKAFDDASNRYGIINDMLDGAMTPYRYMIYSYHRKGLDQMADNPEQARKAITESLKMLEEAYSNKSLSTLPQLFTEYKRDELVGIYQKQETSATKQPIYDFLMKLNASQNSYWKRLLE